MEKKTFYRVCNTITNQGLWYDFQGNFTGLIHNEFNFCTNNELPMPYDENIIGWLSATDSLENLWFWFTKDDIRQLEEHGYYITAFEATDYKFHNNHWVIHQETSVVIEQLPIKNIDKSFSFKDDEIENLVTDWVNGFKNISPKTKTNLSFGFQEGIYKIKELLNK